MKYELGIMNYATAKKRPPDSYFILPASVFLIPDSLFIIRYL